MNTNDANANRLANNITSIGTVRGTVHTGSGDINVAKSPANEVFIGKDHGAVTDVLVITAAAGEDDAVLAVDQGGLGPWKEFDGPPGFGFAVHVRDYLTVDDGHLRFAMVRAPYQGAEAATITAAQLIPVYQPRCLAMCGICAGDPKGTQLGDVIIADRVYRYDVGAVINAKPGGKPNFRPDMMTYQLNPQWKQRAERYSVPPNTSWLTQRPRPRTLQKLWTLKTLLERRNPLDDPELKIHCPSWSMVIEELQAAKAIQIKGRQVGLTEAGRAFIETELLKHAGQLPEIKPWKTHVCPIGTGSSLQRDVDIWDSIRDDQRHVCGLEMEASAIGLAAHIQNVPYMIVVKGVMDHADPAKSDDFRAFAARAAAEVLIGFLRENLRSNP